MRCLTPLCGSAGCVPAALGGPPSAADRPGPLPARRSSPRAEGVVPRVPQLPHQRLVHPLQLALGKLKRAAGQGSQPSGFAAGDTVAWGGRTLSPFVPLRPAQQHLLQVGLLLLMLNLVGTCAAAGGLTNSGALHSTLCKAPCPGSLPVGHGRQQDQRVGEPVLRPVTLQQEHQLKQAAGCGGWAGR